MSLCLRILICLLHFHFGNCLKSHGKDYAMSVASLKGLIDLETSFIDELEGYTEALQLKINTIESFINEVQFKKAEQEQSPEDYVAHPLNSFSLIRRLHEDWNYFELYMSQPVGEVYIDNIKKLIREEAPQDVDLKDAMNAFVRLDDYYDLDTKNLTKGLIDGRQYKSQLTFLDTLSLTTFGYLGNKDEFAMKWYNVTLSLSEKIRAEDKVELYDNVYNATSKFYLDYAKFLEDRGYYLDALDLLNKVSDLNVDVWQIRRAVEEAAHFHKERPQYYKFGRNNVQAGCSYQYPTSTRLTCHLQRHTSHFLTLAPFKVETLSLDPYVVLYHDVIYKSEIHELKSENLSNFKHYRSGSNWNSMKYTNLENNVNDALNYRVKDMSGMQIANDKDFMLINYGLAGHARWPYKDEKEPRNRLATIIFFLSDVLQGGATVLSKPKIAVKPIKGSALMWHNVHNLKHVSCPVLVGSKWTLVKRLHEGTRS